MKRIGCAMAVLLAGCGGAPKEPAVAENAAMLERALQAEADRMEALADNAADPVTGKALENAADRLDNAKNDVARDARDPAR